MLHNIPLPDPKSPPTAADMAVHGVDCVRHPIVGNIVSQTGGTPGEQARNFLKSLYDATRNKIAGRLYRDLSLEEYRAKLRELEAWEAAGGVVNMPPPVMPKSIRG
jgi:hypothetical protein